MKFDQEKILKDKHFGPTRATLLQFQNKYYVEATSQENDRDKQTTIESVRQIFDTLQQAEDVFANLKNPKAIRNFMDNSCAGDRVSVKRHRFG